ncbi:DUF6602 domain-containing protein [Sorangium sp. So ce134]
MSREVVSNNLDSIVQLADRYADELTAQFRTLNFFVQHAGEVGRAHEVFLRGVLQRFLPGKLRCGTGFIASAERVSRQQDIIIYNTSTLPVLLEIGDCLVVDEEAIAGTIEVKTSLAKRADLTEAFDKIMALRESLRGGGFVALYAWEGMSLDAILEQIWNRYRTLSKLDTACIPDVIYVRGQYLLAPNYDGHLDTPPILVLRLGTGHHSEGAGLLSLVERLWISGIQHQANWPWWVSKWRRSVADRYEKMPWPEDLRARVDHELSTMRG